MSFEPNDMNTIHLGNYEEFFVLYMDNELSEEQVKMVDGFLLTHPDLKPEFGILMSAKLPLEEFSFDKKDLLAENMKLASMDEELLLYIDNELPADKKNVVELEIVSNKDYQLQHEFLLQAKLDPSEKIEYPNKKELYRRTERVVSMKVWMRVAAAVVIVAAGGIFYFKNSSPKVAIHHPQTTVDVKKNPVRQDGLKKNEPANSVTSSSDNSNNDQVAVLKTFKKERKPNQSGDSKERKEENPVQQDVIAYTKDRPIVKSIEANTTGVEITEPDVSINKADVTSYSLPRNTIETSVNPEGSIANNNRKGSVKGFLRKATRMIEKRTGINPTNENGELLIGAVAINLK